MQNFEEDLKKAKEQLIFEVGQFERRSDTDAIYALAKYADDSTSRSRIIDFIQKAFDTLRDDAQKKNPGTGGLVNDMIFGAVGRLAGMINEKSLAPLIYKEFQFATNDEQHYELNVEGGTLAIALSILDYEGETKAFDEFLTSYEYRYQGEEFVMEVRYADWMIRKDRTELVTYLENPIDVVKKTLDKDITVDDTYIKKYGEQYKKNLGLVAATTADLDVKESLPVLKEMLAKIKNPVTTEAFLEALSRLEKQKSAPAPKDRMIWMFGKYSSSELVLGQESDNQFVLRARSKTKNKELGNITEADESSSSDV